jgi:hypothetical protein
MRQSMGNQRTNSARPFSSWVPFLIAFTIVFAAGAVILFAATQLLAKERGPVSGMTPTALASPGPSVRLAPAQGGPGSIVTVTGSGWHPGDALEVYMDSFDGDQISPALVVRTVVGADGSFSTSFIYSPIEPLQLPPLHRLLVTVSSATIGDQAFAVFQASGSPSPSPHPSGTPGPGPSPTFTAEPSTPESTPTGECTDSATFVADVTIPDNAQIAPGQNFVKTWRLRNSGTCTWTPDYALVFVRGDQMGGLASVALAERVPPDATVDLSVSLTAPLAPGTYRGDWQLRGADGDVFGLGSSTGPTFWVKVVVKSGTTPVRPATVAPTPVAEISSWRAEYYGNRDLSGPPLVREEADLSFDWGNGSPAVGLAVDGFSARWTRTLAFPAGTYRFYGQSDDGIRVWLDGQLLINEWHDASGTIYSAERTLAAGPHALRIEYYENLGDARLRFWWERPADYPQWRGDYYANMTLSGPPRITRNDPTLDFSWGVGAPVGLPVDGFSVRWTRTLAFEDGLYRFRGTVDDGMRLYVDDRLVISEWQDGAQREVTGEVRLSAGLHAVRVEYYERTGEAVVRVAWEKIASFPDWKGEYWSNRNLSGVPVFVRNDTRIDFNWGRSTPAAGLPADNWSARWSRSMGFEPGLYRFHATADDGIRFYLNGQLRMNEWHDSSGNEVYTVDLAVSGTCQLVIEYFEREGDALARFWWKRIGPLPTSTPTATPTQRPTTVPTVTPTTTPTQRPTTLPTATATATRVPPTPTPTVPPTTEPSPTQEPATATPTPSPTATPTSTETAPSPTPTATATLTPTLSPLPGPAIVRLNEIFPAPVLGASTSKREKDGEWIELYNTGKRAFDLSGWWVDDANAQTPPYRIPRKTVLPPRGFLVLYEGVTGLILNDSGDTVRLIRPDGQVVEQITFGPLPPNASYARDEQDLWHADWPPSPGAPNSPAGLPTLEPAPPGFRSSSNPR